LSDEPIEEAFRGQKFLAFDGNFHSRKTCQTRFL